MNIAYISADFGVPAFGYKGASVHVREMINALAKNGHSIDLYSPALTVKEGSEKTSKTTWPFLGTSQGGSISLHPISPGASSNLLAAVGEAESLLGTSTRIRQELRNLLYNVTLFERAYNSIQAREVDFIYERYSLFGTAGVNLKEKLGVPLILEVNAPLAEEQERMRGLEMKELARETEKKIFRAADSVLAVSTPLKKFIASCGVPEEKITVVPNGIDPTRFNDHVPANKRVDLGLRNKWVCGFVGSLKPWHGTETLLRAFRILHLSHPETHLLFVGEGPMRESLKGQSRAWNLEDAVTFTGNIDHHRVPDYVAAMDVTVAPYIPHENFYFSPIKIFEYMAMGKPVVAGRIGQIEEMISPDTALLFEPGNVDELRNALENLVTDPDLARRLGQRSRRWSANRFTWQRNAETVVEIATRLRNQETCFLP